MTPPERDEFEVTGAMIEAAFNARFGYPFPQPHTVMSLKQIRNIRRELRAVAPLIRAEGYKQGVEDAARVTDGWESRWHEQASSITKTDALSIVLRNIAHETGNSFAMCADAIRALPNQPDASDGA